MKYKRKGQTDEKYNYFFHEFIFLNSNYNKG
jgi:hypothetical protein